MRANARRFLGHPVVRNASALYAVQFTSYLLPLITVPYLARVLQPEAWGAVLLAQALAVWIGLIVEYGFNLSTTREAARVRADRTELARLASGVLGAKLLLILASGAIGLIVALSVPAFRENPTYVGLALLTAACQGLSPLWFFQGLERMLPAAAVNVLARALSTAGVFMLVRGTGDGWMVLALQAGGALLATSFLTLQMYRHVAFNWPGRAGLSEALRSGASMFVFRAASSLYTSANVLILGLFVSPAAVSFYAGAEKMSRAVLAGMSPLSQALFPRISSHLASDAPERAARLVRASGVLMAGGGAVVGALLFAFAPGIVRLILGPAYGEAAGVLRVLALLVPTIAMSNVMGIQWMLPNRMDRAFNYIILLAGALNVCLAVILAPRFGPIGMAWSVVVAEVFVTSAMFVTILRSRRSFWSGARRGIGA